MANDALGIAVEVLVWSINAPLSSCCTTWTPQRWKTPLTLGWRSSSQTGSIGALFRLRALEGAPLMIHLLSLAHSKGIPALIITAESLEWDSWGDHGRGHMHLGERPC